MAMYVSGRKCKPKSKSNKVRKKHCDHCLMTAQFIPATWHCSFCEEFLCPSCGLIHARDKLTKGHVLRNVDKMSTDTHSVVTVPKWQECSEHAGEAIELFCKSHNALCCLICLKNHHKTCLNRAVISDLANDFSESDEFKSFKTDLKILRMDECIQRDKYKADNKKIKSEQCKTLEEIDKIAESAHLRINKLKENTVLIAEKIMTENKGTLEHRYTILRKLNVDIKLLLNFFEEDEETQQPERLFIALKKLQSKLEHAKSSISRLKEGNYLRSLTLDCTEEIDTLLNATSVLGTFPETHLTLKYFGEINVKSPSDQEDCSIVGIAFVSPGQMIVTDYDNKNVKVIDIQDNTIVQTKVYSVKPHGVTILDNNKIGVTLSQDKTIQLLTADVTLTVNHNVKVDDKCLSLVQEQMHGHLIVSFHEKVQVLDVSGRVVREFTTDAEGNPLFNNARYLALSPDHSMLYVSDYNNHTVTCLALDGNVISVYRDAKLREPMGIVVDNDGHVIVCGNDTENIHVLSPECVKLKIIPMNQFRLEFPTTIALSPTKDRLYISSASTTPSHRNSIKVFELFTEYHNDNEGGNDDEEEDDDDDDDDY